MPVPTQHTLFERAVELLDAISEDRGWGCPALLFGIGRSDAPGAEVELAVKEIDGCPAESLVGFSAPLAWTAIGVCAEGWAYPDPMAEHEVLPAAATGPGRERVRSLVLLSRDGKVAGRLRWQDGRVVKEAPVEGLMMDCLRRTLGM